MMRYVLLLRGINVGGKNKVSMAELKEQLTAAGFENPSSYINSGNLFFDSEDKVENIKETLDALFMRHYDFDVVYSLFSAEALRLEAEQLPAWWQEEMGRKDVLFFTDEADKQAISASIVEMDLVNEIVHFGSLGIFWGKYDEDEFLKTAYHKQLIKQPYYKRVTIRNGKTFEKLVGLVGE
ncbi:DUF1697 domain-containing protein [Fundicoccus culcitae]|uniref:DUF1697 domain-containing protein n=1 Tax=Fundicoccus culcitae TaxID=2969821 RepID=A0ABY5P8G9_9LACT|nr:DUF1697 domain-containing protein [Fundicoccus culcitae]UUX34713.1 DUF1697 domain-containing protein [Fundicoccus culcitae]